MIYHYFNKYQINLKDGKDKQNFKVLLQSSLEEEKKEVNKLPSVNTNKTLEVRVRESNAKKSGIQENYAIEI
jgi:hypothetical protein